MRDDSAKWAPATGRERGSVTIGSVTLSPVLLTRQTLISGPYEAALKLAGMRFATGWPEPVDGDTYALRLRRDRILVINGLALEDGWHDAAGLAVSDMSSGYAALELKGSNAFAVLQRGTEISRTQPSASVARLFYGHAAFIYARGPGCYRLHCGAAQLESVWELLATFAEQADSQAQAT